MVAPPITAPDLRRYLLPGVTGFRYLCELGEVSWARVRRSRQHFGVLHAEGVRVAFKNKWTLRCQLLLYGYSLMLRLAVDCIRIGLNRAKGADSLGFGELGRDVLFGACYGGVMVIVYQLHLSIWERVSVLMRETEDECDGLRAGENVCSGVVGWRLLHEFGPKKRVRIKYEAGEEGVYYSAERKVLLPSGGVRGHLMMVSLVVHEVGHAISDARGGVWWKYAGYKENNGVRDTGIALLKSCMVLSLCDYMGIAKCLGAIVFGVMLWDRSISLYEECCASKLGRDCFDRNFKISEENRERMKGLHNIWLGTYFVYWLEVVVGLSLYMGMHKIGSFRH